MGTACWLQGQGLLSHQQSSPASRDRAWWLVECPMERRAVGTGHGRPLPRLLCPRSCFSQRSCDSSGLAHLSDARGWHTGARCPQRRALGPSLALLPADPHLSPLPCGVAATPALRTTRQSWRGGQEGWGEPPGAVATGAGGGLLGPSRSSPVAGKGGTELGYRARHLLLRKDPWVTQRPRLLPFWGQGDRGWLCLCVAMKGACQLPEAQRPGLHIACPPHTSKVLSRGGALASSHALPCRP